jgi:hypothetical protein
VPVKKVGSQKPLSTSAGGWGKWKEEKCNSGCIKDSQGEIFFNSKKLSFMFIS